MVSKKYTTNQYMYLAFSIMDVHGFGDELSHSKSSNQYNVSLFQCPNALVVLTFCCDSIHVFIYLWEIRNWPCDQWTTVNCLNSEMHLPAELYHASAHYTQSTPCFPFADEGCIWIEGLQDAILVTPYTHGCR